MSGAERGNALEEAPPSAARPLATSASAVALLWACGATLYLLAGAGYDGAGTTALLGGSDADVGHVPVSLLSANGAWIAGLLMVLTLLSGIPLGVALTQPRAHRTTALVVAVTLAAFCLIGGRSIGLMYAPAALALFAAAALIPVRSAPRPEDPSRPRSG